MSQEPNRNEAHLINFPAGHILSLDCWCEPCKMYWKKNEHGLKVFVVEHTDDAPHHHKAIIKERNKKQDWITQMLDTIEYHP